MLHGIINTNLALRQWLKKPEVISHTINVRLHEFTSDDITSNYKMTFRRGFLYGKNKYVNSFFFGHIVGKIK
jgi:hypothetical protein